MDEDEEVSKDADIVEEDDDDLVFDDELGKDLGLTEVLKDDLDPEEEK